MKTNKYIKILLIVLSFTIIFNTNLSIKHGVDAYATNESSEIVMDVDTLRVLGGKNYNAKKYMASTTKILTALVVIEHCNMSDIITVSSKTIGVEGSSIYLEEGEKLSVKDLLYGLMLRSGNDCAETLALHCSGSIEDFALLMNDTAKKCGANNSNFVNPHGLHDDNHYTTAYDLALISCYAMKNPTFREIVSTKKVEIPYTTRNYNRILINKNKMLTEFEGSNGIKTGYTKKAGRCLVSSCVRNGMELVCVVLSCPPMFERSKELLTNAFSNYENYKIIESDNIVGFSKLNDSNVEYALHVKNDVILPLSKTEYENLRIVYNYPKIVNNELKNDIEIGFVEIYCQNNLIFKEKIYTILG